MLIVPLCYFWLKQRTQFAIQLTPKQEVEEINIKKCQKFAEKERFKDKT
jgi:hypothetical protein